MDFSKWSLRQQAIAVSLAAALALAAYAKLVHEPFSRQAALTKLRIKKSQTQLAELQAKFPPVEEKRQRIGVLKSQCEELLSQIAEVESKLPPKKETSQLIGEFTRLAKELRLLSIRQKTVTKDGYQRIFIELKLAAPYPAAIAYLSNLESISPFLKVEEVTINESSGKSFEEGGAPVRVVVSSILGDAPLEQSLHADDRVKAPEVKRDILTSTARPLAELNEKDFRIEGITYTEEGTATVIINGEVFRVNSEIKGYRIKKILPDSVILTDGVQDHLLSLHQ